MATKTGTKVTKNPIEKAYEELNRRVTVLEKLVQQLASQKPKARKSREYTDEQRKAIRARLLAGQEAARKRREGRVKTESNGKTAK
jgi:benzoyl-CoA reductase/2-hydroxyglutaryl-CoA dehydratase subunit BcrC/BadD/HgdB